MLFYMICNGACINGYGFVAIMAKKTCGNPFCHTFWNRWTIRWDFVGNSLAWTPMKFQQNSNDLFCGKMLWQNVSLKCFCFSFSGVWQNVLSQHFCTKKIRGISWKFRWESVQTHEMPTKSWRNKIAKIQLYKDSLQMVKYHGRATLQFVYKYVYIYICIYVYYSIYIYIYTFFVFDTLGVKQKCFQWDFHEAQPKLETSPSDMGFYPPAIQQSYNRDLWKSMGFPSGKWSTFIVDLPYPS